MAKRGKKGVGSVVGRVVLAAAIGGGGLFLGIRWSGRAVALLDETHTRHVVELIPPEEVTGAPTVHRARASGDRAHSRSRHRRRAADEE